MCQWEFQVPLKRRSSPLRSLEYVEPRPGSRRWRRRLARSIVKERLVEPPLDDPIVSVPLVARIVLGVLTLLVALIAAV